MDNFDSDHLNLNWLLSLKALLSEKNVTLAGEKLGISQSTMSHYLKQLRLHFGDPLLVKGQKNTLILTPLAESLRAPLENLSRDLHQIFYPENQFFPEKAKIQFNIAMPDYIAMVLLPDLLKKIRLLAPKISIAIHSLNHIKNIEQFEDQKLDLAIGMYKNPPLELKKQFLFADAPVCVSCKQNKNIQNNLDLETYLKTPQVLIGYKSDEDSIYINTVLEKNTQKLDIAAIVPYTLSILHLIPDSPFVTITLEKIAQQYCHLLNLKIHSLPFSMKPYKASQYWHIKNDKAPEQIWLREMVREVVSSPPPQSEGGSSAFGL